MIWLYGVIGLAAAAAGAAGAWQVREWKAEADMAEVLLANHEAASEQFWAQRARSEKVDSDVQKRLRAAGVAADGARSQLERLRTELEVDQATGHPAVCAGVAQRAATLSGLLGQCSGRYTEVARDAGKYAEQLRGWQALIPEEAQAPDD